MTKCTQLLKGQDSASHQARLAHEDDNSCLLNTGDLVLMHMEVHLEDIGLLFFAITDATSPSALCSVLLCDHIGVNKMANLPGTSTYE